VSRLEQLLKLIKLDPADPLGHYAVGLQYFQLERWNDAIAAFEKTLVRDPHYTPAYYHKARAEIRAARREAAQATLAAGMECARSTGDAKTEREMRELLETIS